MSPANHGAEMWALRGGRLHPLVGSLAEKSLETQVPRPVTGG